MLTKQSLCRRTICSLIYGIAGITSSSSFFIFCFIKILIYSKLHEILIEIQKKRIIISNQQRSFIENSINMNFALKNTFFCQNVGGLSYCMHRCDLAHFFKEYKKNSLPLFAWCNIVCYTHLEKKTEFNTKRITILYINSS